MTKTYKKVHVSRMYEMGVVVDLENHHPLSKKAIRNLLRHAKQTGDCRVRNSIQIRLQQGIKGYVFPKAIKGLVPRKETEVAILYLEHNYKEPTNALVNRLYRVMNF